MNVTLLYTANMQGDLHRLPRLFTLIQQQRQSSDGVVFLLDLGDTCTPDSWPCRSTQGRAPFLVLDSMGYDAAVIGGPERIPIPPASLRRLIGDMIMQVVIWERAKTLSKRGVNVTIAPGMEPPDNHAVICVDRTSDALPSAGDKIPVLGDVAQDSLARVDLNWPDWTVQATRVFEISSTTPVDPTISAVIELVESQLPPLPCKH